VGCCTTGVPKGTVLAVSTHVRVRFGTYLIVVCTHEFSKAAE
jgi:hypothetical protein